MLRIAKSLITIAAVAAIAVGATGAYFSDEVKISGNSFKTGTIDIDVDGINDSSHTSYTYTDMKPGYVVNSDFKVNNTGSNPANIYKMVHVTTNDVNLAAVVNYKLSSLLPANGWNQTLYNYDATLATVNNNKVFLGMLPAHTTMNVTESYMMDINAGNTYQDKTLGFEITVTAEQLQGTLVLEDKSAAPEYKVLGTTVAKGTLNYGVMDKKFDYNFSGVAPLANTPYSLVIGTDPYLGGVTLGTATSDAGGAISIPANSVELGSVTNQKVWLVVSADWNTAGMTGWNPSSYLFETGLIDYYDSGV